ncbi:thioesterase family protein [Deinococcus sonorensis]|uniref:Thioesterase family protein n=2 Tax=Deinococcus sonorensis TaxID=309891 RepID=A0AAU7UCC2_9DEIO
MDWSRAHRTHIQLRYSDTDMMGHINNAAYAQFLETARILYMQSLLPEPQGSALPVVLARLDLNYRREVHLGQQVEVELLTGAVGRSSWQYLFRILADGQLAADGLSVQVHLDPLTRRGAPLPGPLREALEAQLPLVAGGPHG